MADLTGDPTYADAILDRIVHTLTGSSSKTKSCAKNAHRKEAPVANAAVASRKGKADESGGKRAAKED